MIKKIRRRERWMRSSRDDINIELTALCNLRCQMCTHSNLAKEDLGHMDFDLFCHVVDEATTVIGHRPSFRLVGMGEPLFYPHLLEALDYVRKKYPRATIRLNTNGVLLDEERVLGLLTSPPDVLLISLTAPDSESYQWLTGENEFGRVIKNIERLLALRRESRFYFEFGRPRIMIDFIRTDRTIDDVENSRDFWEANLTSEDKINIRTIVNWAGQIDGKKLDTTLKSPLRYPCLSLWNIVAVNKDGDVFPCLMAFSTCGKSDLLLGNISNSTMRELYGGQKLVAMKASHKRGEWQCAADCVKCDAYKGYPNIWIRNRLVPFLDKRWF